MPSVEEIVAARQRAATEAKLKREKQAKDGAEKKRLEKVRREEAEARELLHLQLARASARKAEKEALEAAERAKEEKEKRERAIARGERVPGSGGAGENGKAGEKGKYVKQFAHMRSTNPTPTNTRPNSSSSSTATTNATAGGITHIPIQLTREERRRIAEEREFGITPDRSTTLFEKARSGGIGSSGSSSIHRNGALGKNIRASGSGSMSMSGNGYTNGKSVSQPDANGIKTLGSGLRKDKRSIGDMILSGNGSRSGSEDIDDRGSDFFALPGVRKGSSGLGGSPLRKASSRGCDYANGTNNGHSNAQAGPSIPRFTPEKSNLGKTPTTKAPKSRHSETDTTRGKHGIVAGNARKRDLPSDSDDLDGASDDDDSESGSDDSRRKRASGMGSKRARVDEGRDRAGKSKKSGSGSRGGGGGILASLGFDPWGGRDSKKYYARDIDSDEDDMEANPLQIQREEARAARQAREDDRREEEREKRRIEEKKRKKSGGG